MMCRLQWCFAGQIDSFAAAVNVAQQQQRADELEAIMSAPAFGMIAAAQQVIAEMKGLKTCSSRIRRSRAIWRALLNWLKWLAVIAKQRLSCCLN